MRLSSEYRQIFRTQEPDISLKYTVEELDWEHVEPDVEVQANLEDAVSWSSDRIQEIAITVNEIMLNGRDACSETPKKLVQCYGYITEDEVVFNYLDRGPGFDHKTAIQKMRSLIQTAEDLEEFDHDCVHGLGFDQGGTGLYSLVRFSTRFEYTPRGNRLIATFRETRDK